MTEKDIKEGNSTKEKSNRNKENIEFSIAFNKNGDSFQNVMEKILISKITNAVNDD